MLLIYGKAENRVFFLKNHRFPIFDQKHLNPRRPIQTPVLAGVTGR